MHRSGTRGRRKSIYRNAKLLLLVSRPALPTKTSMVVCKFACMNWSVVACLWLIAQRWGFLFPSFFHLLSLSVREEMFGNRCVAFSAQRFPTNSFWYSCRIAAFFLLGGTNLFRHATVMVSEQKSECPLVLMSRCACWCFCAWA